MLSVDQEVFICIPDVSTQRILHKTHVVAAGDVITLQLDEPTSCDLEASQDVLIYFTDKREFMQQPARVEALDTEAEPAPMLNVSTQGEPVSAESRQCYRVSTVLMDLEVEVDSENCPLLDISLTGFSFRTAKQYGTGQKLNVRLIHEGRDYVGEATVQSIDELGDDIRYGCYCVEKAAGNLMKGLQQKSLAAQREQLKRMAGAS